MTKHGKRFIAVAAAGLVLASALSGCSSGSGDGGSGKVTLTFANADPSATWAKVITGFEKKNPDITVKQLNIPYAQFSSTINQRMSQGGGGIDLYVVDTGQAIDYNNRGYLADLSDMKADALAAAVSPDMVEQNVIDGKLLTIEPWTTSQFLYYNKDLLAKAGVAAPSSDPSKPWTWEQLSEAAAKVKKAHAAQYPFLFDQWDTYYQLQPLGVSAGGGNGIDAKGKVDFDNAGWQKALSWYHDLFTSGISPRGITNDKNGALWQEGKAAFTVSGPWGLALANQRKLNYGIAPEPYFEGGKPASSTDSWSVGISSKSKNIAAAKKFLRYMTIDPTGNTESAEVAGITPTNKVSFAAYAKKANASAGAASADFGTIMEYELKNNAVHRPSVVGYSVFEPGADSMFADIRDGTDPKSAAEKADASIESQLKRLK